MCLDCSRSKAGEMMVECCQIQPAHLLREIADVMVCPADAKAVALRRCGMICHCDRGRWLRLKQILTPMCCNAIKFTDQGGVKLTFLRSAPRPRAQAALSRPRQRHRDRAEGKSRLVHHCQDDVSTTRRFGGTGLGRDRQASCRSVGGRSECQPHGVGSELWVE